jgi:hypothetical protein
VFELALLVAFGVAFVDAIGDGMRSFSITVTLIFCPGFKLFTSKEVLDESLPGLGLISKAGRSVVLATGFGVGVTSGFGVGFAVGVGVGFGVGLTVGFGVGFAVGDGVGFTVGAGSGVGFTVGVGAGIDGVGAGIDGVGAGIDGVGVGVVGAGAVGSVNITVRGVDIAVAYVESPVFVAVAIQVPAPVEVISPCPSIAHPAAVPPVIA